MAERITAIEISFAVPVSITREEERMLANLIDGIAKANEPEGHVHWLAGIGSKPTWSQADAAFLGKPADPNAPERGEPTFDHSVLSFETACRERYDDEPARSTEER